MIRHNLQAALRNLLRFKNQSAISLVGLVLGLSCVFVIAAWTIQEWQYDRFYSHPENVFMVTTDIRDNNGNDNTVPETPQPLAGELKDRIPEIEHSCHFIYLYGGRIIQVEDKRFKETGLAANPDLFDVLDFKLISGSPEALEESNSILLTEGLAAKLFPRADPLGQSLTFAKDRVLTVTGILKNIPGNSSLQFDYIVPYRVVCNETYGWWALSDATFIRTNPGTDLDKTRHLARDIFREHIPDEQFDLNLMPITKLRFWAKFDFFNAEHGSLQMLLIFAGIALLILVLACLNYINLVSANYLKRRREVIIKKINGASINSLIGYFISESVVMSIFAWIFAVPVSMVLIQVFESMLEVRISLSHLYASLGAGLPASLLFIGLISGLYPAIMTSSFVPSLTREKTNSFPRFQGRWKSIFVLYQFVLSISLAIVSLAIFKQSSYLQRFEVGYERDNIIQVMAPRSKVQEFQAMRNRLLANPMIEDLSFAGSSPVSLPPISSTEGWFWKGLAEGTHTSMYSIHADHNYLNFFQMQLKEGRFFSSAGTDIDKIVINERLADFTGFKEPIGQLLFRGEKQYEIIGIVVDFHFQHLSNDIHPLMFRYSITENNLLLKPNERSDHVLGQIQDLFVNFSDEPLHFDFVADMYDALYRNENKLTTSILVFTLLAIVLSCIGLLGLITFTTETRTREVGIRKVNGASTRAIILWLNRGIIRWYLLGLVISCFLAWMGLNKWLEGFTNRISLSWWIFFLGAFIILVLALLTVSFKTWNAATRNPADTLRSE